MDLPDARRTPGGRSLQRRVLRRRLGPVRVPDDGRGRRAAARRVNERELRILRVHLEASLLDEELADATLAGALHEHRELLAGRESRVDRAPAADRGREPAATGGRPSRPGDRNRAGELRGRAGWAWSRLFRRYDEYEAALAQLHAAAEWARRPDRRSDHAEPVNA